MRDVASTANVSVQTVSNYVNGRRDLMGASTQRRVATAMADLSYHPDQTARNLRSGRTQTGQGAAEKEFGVIGVSGNDGDPGSFLEEGCRVRIHSRVRDRHVAGDEVDSVGLVVVEAHE